MNYRRKPRGHTFTPALAFQVILGLACALGLSGIGVGVSAQDAGDRANAEAPRERVAGDASYFNPLNFTETRTPLAKSMLSVDLADALKIERVANARLQANFTETHNDSVLAVEYEGERTEAPVIMGFFVSDKCDTEIDHQAYRASARRSGNLTVIVKSKPKNFGAYDVLVDHAVVTERRMKPINTVRLANQETFEPIPFSVGGLMPGVNRFTLRIRYTNGAGVTTISKGVTHDILVHELTAFGARSDWKLQGSETRVGDLTLWRGSMSRELDFTLSPGIDAEDVELRLLRQGKRSIARSKAPQRIRTQLDDDLTQTNWQVLASRALESGGDNILKVEAISEGTWKVHMAHWISATSSVLPVNDDWSYRLELRDKRRSALLETMDFTCKASITAPGDASMSAQDAGSEAVTGTFATR